MSIVALWATCFLLEKCENLLQCKRFSHFFNKKYQRICNIYVLMNIFNETLTNNVVNFEQPAPECQIMQSDLGIHCLLVLPV